MPADDPNAEMQAVGKAPAIPKAGHAAFVPMSDEEKKAREEEEARKKAAAEQQPENTKIPQATPEELAAHKTAIENNDLSVHMHGLHVIDAARKEQEQNNAAAPIAEITRDAAWEKAVAEALQSLDIGTTRANGDIELSHKDYHVNQRELTRLTQTALDGINWDSESRNQHETKRQKIINAIDGALDGRKDGHVSREEIEAAKQIFFKSLSESDRNRVQKDSHGYEYVNTEELYHLLTVPPLPVAASEERKR